MAQGKKPLQNGNNGRNAKGQFVKGNSGGPGNPYAKKAAELKNALYKATTEADIKVIAEKLIEKAKRGDVPSIKELFDRLWGKAAQPIEAPEGGVFTLMVVPPNGYKRRKPEE